MTEDNWRAKETPGLEDLTEVGRLKFQCQFKAGMDESHREFVVDNDSRETYESWEACKAEGVRGARVEEEVPPAIQKMHEDSLTEGRDVLENADPEEKKKWITKDGNDWSGAFGHDPKAYLNSTGRRRAQPGKDHPVHDPHNPSSDDEDDDDESDEENGNEGHGQDGASSLVTMDAEHKKELHPQSHGSVGENENGSETSRSKRDVNAANKASERRKHRGLMQWKPVRNAAFAKDEAKFAVKKAVKKMTSLDGREPDVETETGT